MQSRVIAISNAIWTFLEPILIADGKQILDAVLADLKARLDGSAPTS